MIFKTSESVSAKILRATLFILVVQVIAIFLVFKHYLTHDLLNDQLASFKSASHSLAEVTEYHINSNDLLQVQRHLAFTSLDRSFSMVLVISDKFDVVASNLRIEVGNPLESVVEQGLFSKVVQKRVELNESLVSDIWFDDASQKAYSLSPMLNPISNIILPQTQVHYLLIEYDLAPELNAAYYQAGTAIATVLLILISCSLLLSWYLKVNLGKRTKEIEHSLELYSAGYMSERLVEGGNDEITRIAQSVNIMLENAEQAHNELEKKEYETREIINAIIDAVITIDERGTVLSFNPAAEKMFEVQAVDMLGKNVKLLMPEADKSNHDQYLRNYLTSGKAKIIGIGREVEGIRKSGKKFPMRLSINELPKREGEMRRFIGICVDISEIKLQQEQIRRTLKMDALGKMVGGIAHDFNNVLGIIVGYSQLLAKASQGNEKATRYAGEIEKAVNRGADLTKRLLAFSKNKPIQTEIVDVNQLLAHSSTILEKAATPSIKLQIQLAEQNLYTRVNISELEDVLLNLTINAVHATNENGLVRITTKLVNLTHYQAKILNLLEGNYAAIAVVDNGCGMSEETLEHVFDPFFTTKGDGGTGLGLSQAYSFCDRMKGRIVVESELHKGTQFTVYLPFIAEPFSNEVKGNVSNSSVCMQGKEKILLVDDEPAILQSLSIALTEYGYAVSTAADGAEALNLLQLQQFDVLISDIVMPMTDGFELAKHVQRQYPSMTIQLISGYISEKYSNIQDPLLFNTLTKPVKIEDLLNNIRQMLDAKHKH